MATPVAATNVLPAPAPRPAPATVMGPPDGLITPGPSQPAPSPAPPILAPAPRPTASNPPPTGTASPTIPQGQQPGPAQRGAIASPPPAREGRTNAGPISGGYDINAASDLPVAGPIAPSTDRTTDSALPIDAVPDGPARQAAPPIANPPSIWSLISQWWPWLAGTGAIVVLFIGWGLVRRKQRPLRLPAPERAATPPDIVPVPQSAASTPPLAPTAPLTPLGRRADLTVTFEPLTAQSTLLNLRIRYAITVRNSGTIAAAPLSLRIGMFAGSQAHPQGITQWLSRQNEAAHDRLETLAPGESHRFEGELAAPLEALNPLTIEGRTLAIPIVAVDVRYGHAAGEAPIEGQAARAFVVGRESGKASAKLAPFRLDQGPTSFAPLGQRDTGIGIVA